jgi:hypothetical protein
VLELLKCFNIDFVVYYSSEDKINVTDNGSYCLRTLFSYAKFRYIYGVYSDNFALLINPVFADNNKYNDTDIMLTDTKTVNVDKLKYACKDILFESISERVIQVNIPNEQEIHYRKLINENYNKLISGDSYANEVADSNLVFRNRHINDVLENNLQIADDFLNNPADDKYLYNTKFSDKKMINAEKLQPLYQIVYSHLFGGLIENKSFSSKKGNLLVVCTKQTTVNYLKKSLPILNNERVIVTTLNSFLSNNVFSNVTTYIIYDNEWDNKYQLKVNSQIQFNVVNNYFGLEAIDKFNLVYRNSLEINKLNSAYNRFVRYYNKNYIYNEDFYISSIELEPLTSKVLTEYTKCVQTVYDNATYHKIREILTDKMGIAYSKDKVYDILYSKPDSFSKPFISYYYPFCYNLILNKFGLKPLYLLEGYELNDNLNYVENTIIMQDMFVCTEYGCGKLKNVVGDYVTVSIFNYQDVVIPKELVYFSDDESFKIYANSISKLGDSNIDKALVKNITMTIDNSDSDSDDSTIELNVSVMNGLFSLYTMNTDIDNTKLKGLDFRAYTDLTMFDLTNDESFNLFLDKMELLHCPSSCIEKNKMLYKLFKGKINFMTPDDLNYFTDYEVSFKFYLIFTIDGKCFGLLDKRFDKQIKKLSRAFNPIKLNNMYIQQFDSIGECRYALLRTTKFINVVNINSILKFFTSNYPIYKTVNFEEVGGSEVEDDYEDIEEPKQEQEQETEPEPEPVEDLEDEVDDFAPDDKIKEEKPSRKEEPKQEQEPVEDEESPKQEPDDKSLLDDVSDEDFE